MLALSTIRHIEADAYSGLVAGLRAEFHSDDVELVAAMFLDAEADDFRWDSRVAERGLGPCEDEAENAEVPLDRVAFLGQLAGNWYAATAGIDGEGRLWSLQFCTDHGCYRDAKKAFMAFD